MRVFIICSLLLLSSQLSFGQEDSNTYTLPGEIYLNDTLPDVEIPSVVIVAKPVGYYRKLRRDVYRAYPYALRVVSLVEQVEEHKSTLKKKRHKKRYVKKKEEVLKEMFEEKMKKMTKRQGRIMVRLINRELKDDTVFELIKEYKGGLNASFWQVVAKKYDSDLKAVYEPDNPESEDFDIELIVEGIESTYKLLYLNDVKIDKPTYRDIQP